MRKIKLKHPLEQDSFFNFMKTPLIINSISLRRPKAKDIIGLNFVDPEKTTESMLVLISRLSGYKIELVSQLDMTDLSTISGHLNKMIEGGIYE